MDFSRNYCIFMSKAIKLPRLFRVNSTTLRVWYFFNIFTAEHGRPPQQCCHVTNEIHAPWTSFAFKSISFLILLVYAAKWESKTKPSDRIGRRVLNFGFTILETGRLAWAKYVGCLIVGLFTVESTLPSHCDESYLIIERVLFNKLNSL